MRKGVFMMLLITVMVLGLLFTGCEQVSQILLSPTLEEPDPPTNTGDCISQVGPVTSDGGGQRALAECRAREEPPEDFEEPPPVP